MPQNAGGQGKDYRESDVRMVFDSAGAEWHEWSEPLQWLRTWAPRDSRFRSADVRHGLERDLTRLAQEDVPFTTDPGAVYRLAHEHRRPRR